MVDNFGYKKKYLVKVNNDAIVKNMFDNTGYFESISAIGDICKFSIKEFEKLLVYLSTQKERNQR